MSWLLYSFYTKDTIYEHSAQRLEASIKKFCKPDINYCLEGIEPKGSWIKNCNVKPFCVLNKIKEVKMPLVWLDSDAEMMRHPNLFDELSKKKYYDISFHTRDWDHNRKTSAIIYFDYSPKVLDFITEWCDKTQSKNDKNELYDTRGGRLSMEQHMFYECVVKSNLKFHPMSADYCAILQQDQKTFNVKEIYDVPAIKHHQDSRIGGRR